VRARGTCGGQEALRHISVEVIDVDLLSCNHMDRACALVGDYYHPHDALAELFSSLVEQMGMTCQSLSHPDEVPWETLDRFRVFVLSTEGRVNPEQDDSIWMTQEQEYTIARFVEAGGALIVHHSGLASYRRVGPFFDTVRGYFLMHPEHHPTFLIRAAGPADLPALPDFSAQPPVQITDEMYFTYVDTSRTTALLDLWSDRYGGSRAAWAHQAGAGRVFCFTPGHGREVLSDERIAHMLFRGIRWSLSR